MGSRREQVLLVALVAFVTLIVLTVSPPEEANPFDFRPSTFQSARHGTKALYLTLEELGVGVDRRFSAFVGGDTLAGPLVVLAPVQSPSPAELDALLDWVESGGTLVYVARPDDATLDSLGLALVSLLPDSARGDPYSWEGRRATPDHHAWGRGAPPLEGFRWAFADTTRAFDQPLESVVSTSAADPVVVRYRLGEGQVIAWSDAQPLTNQRLRGSGAALVFARMAADLTPPGGGTLVFDEYHHGYRGEGSPVRATLRFLRDTGPGRMALQLALAGLGVLLLLGRRFGAPLPPPPARRRSPLEHVEALAGAYRQAGARATARRLLLAGLARRLGRGPHEARDEGGFLERLGTRLPVGQEAARAVREEWSRGEKADLVALSRDIDTLLEEVKRT